MSIDLHFLGRPGDDNATLIEIDSGNAISRLLFDCGSKCLDHVPISTIQDIEHVLFSHFHMDHICGFDSFFRHNYNRPEGAINIWGPSSSIELMQNRFLGYTWNLHHNQRGEWVVNEINQNQVCSAAFRTREAFGKKNIRPNRIVPASGSIFSHEFFSISAIALDHGSIQSIGYRIDEPSKENVDPDKLTARGYRPGPWIRVLKDSSRDDQGTLDIDGRPVSIQQLRDELLVNTEGEVVACLTDYILEPGSEKWRRVVEWLKGVDVLVSESQYIEADYNFARSNYHMTAKRVAQLAAEAGVGELIIQHVSRRYTFDEWRAMLLEARAVFPNTRFPEGWRKLQI